MRRFDLVVIGAGPAGMAATVTACEAGLTVLLVDEQAEPGGQIWRAVERNRRDRPANLSFLGEDYAAGIGLVGRFRASGAEYWPSTMVWHLTCPEKGDKNVVVARNGGTEQVAAGQVLIASGAMERPVPVPGWTLPGVLTIGAAQTALKFSGLYPGCGHLGHHTLRRYEEGVTAPAPRNVGLAYSGEGTKAAPGDETIRRASLSRCA